MGWYLQVLKKYAVFSGRAQRAEFWFYALFNAIILFVLELLAKSDALSAFRFLAAIYALAVFIPGVAVTVRRLHDTSRTGWWALLPLIPVIGPIVLLVFMCLDSTPGGNDYGPNPKAA